MAGHPGTAGEQAGPGVDPRPRRDLLRHGPRSEPRRLHGAATGRVPRRLVRQEPHPGAARPRRPRWARRLGRQERSLLRSARHAPRRPGGRRPRRRHPGHVPRRPRRAARQGRLPDRRGLRRRRLGGPAPHHVRRQVRQEDRQLRGQRHHLRPSRQHLVDAVGRRHETWDVIRARRNVRQYTDQPIPRDDLERILEAGRRSPSSSNWKPWHFVVVTDRDSLVELAKAWPRGGAHIARSAATIALVAEQPEDEQIRQRIAYDLSQATVLTMITVTDLGIGSGHSAVRDQEQGQRVLGFPDHFFASYMIGFGYPADRPLRPVLILSGLWRGEKAAPGAGWVKAAGGWGGESGREGGGSGGGGGPGGAVGPGAGGGRPPGPRP